MRATEERLEARMDEMRKAHEREILALTRAHEQALTARDEQAAQTLKVTHTNHVAQQEVAVRLASASAEALARQREEALEGARALHAAEVQQLKSLGDSLTAQREKQFAELLALEKERQRHEMSDAKSLLGTRTLSDAASALKHVCSHRLPAACSHRCLLSSLACCLLSSLACCLLSSPACCLLSSPACCLLSSTRVRVSVLFALLAPTRPMLAHPPRGTCTCVRVAQRRASLHVSRPSRMPSPQLKGLRVRRSRT